MILFTSGKQDGMRAELMGAVQETECGTVLCITRVLSAGSTVECRGAGHSEE